MFAQFTASARRVMQRAFREAKRCEHDFVGTEHLLYGLLDERDGPAVQLLRSLNSKPEQILEKVELSLQRHQAGLAMERFPLSPASKRAFQTAANEAAQCKQTMIGPEHLLLGLLRESDGEAAQLLTANGICLSDVREAVARVSPDVYHEAQIRADEPSRALSDNPTVEELERWVSPGLGVEQTADDMVMVPTAPLIGEPPAIEAQLRRTQWFLGAFGGYAVGHWFFGSWQLAVLFATIGIALAYLNRVWPSIIVCGIIALIVAERHKRGFLEPIDPLNYMVALPIGILFGSLLSDLWRFALPGDQGHPVKPSGVPVEEDTRLLVGSIVLARSRGRWYRAQVVELEEGGQVQVQFLGWPASWNEVLPRSELQIEQARRRAE